MPAVDEIYPADGATSIAIAGPALGFEGEHRPGHFDGVAIVCLKLFGIVAARRACTSGRRTRSRWRCSGSWSRDVNLPLDVRVGADGA